MKLALLFAVCIATICLSQAAKLGKSDGNEQKDQGNLKTR